MSPNASTVKKFLLTAGLLIVLGQGLWQLPELQDYLFPIDHVKLCFRQTSKELPRIEGDLITLNERIDYLKWIQAHNGPNRKVSADGLQFFPFFESIRSLAPRYFWHLNIRLAHKARVQVERKLRYLDTLLKSADADFRAGPSYDSPIIPTQSTAVFGSMQIKQFRDQLADCNAKLMDLTKQLAWLESNGYKK